jgi:hypothetical protein
MRAMVVYESMFGNTREVAEAVARGLGTVLTVDLVEVGQAPDLTDLEVDLLVVGAPTHALGLSRPGTRHDAAQRTGRVLVSTRRGVREWLEAAGPVGLRVAAFDTHVKQPTVPGHAGRAAARRLRRLGCTQVAAPESYYVDGLEGPLLDGETARAAAWGAELGRALVPAA